MGRTAAALIIGNEILTGKVREENVSVLAKELFGLGVRLQRVVICADQVEVIARDLTELRTKHDLVFTSGGVGPTHDDVTVQAVARSLDRSLVRSQELAGLLEQHFGSRCTERHLRMADLPEGFQLVRTGSARWPAVVVDNVYVLPGLPEVFRMKMPILRERLGAGEAFVSRAVYTRCDEAEVADLLDRLVAEHPQVAIGSYPVWNERHYRVKLTVDGADATAVAAAAAALEEALPEGSVVPPPES